ncbi:hypothetical protein IW262DRAFT_1417879 [Armillaria fumosa]|nr:hypothetical protein IW262DRAFT_1417879 [Armillaria fumosa]
MSSILDRSQNDILLLVQAENRLEHEEPVNARAQLVAEAVAAFNENNAQLGSDWIPSFGGKCHARHCHGWHVAYVLQNSRSEELELSTVQQARILLGAARLVLAVIRPSLLPPFSSEQQGKVSQRCSGDKGTSGVPSSLPCYPPHRLFS